NITVGASTWQVSFSKTGALGGSISGAGCNRTLGASMPPDAGMGGGAGGGSGGGSTGGGVGGGATAGGSGGSGGAGGSTGGGSSGGATGGGGGQVTGQPCSCASSEGLLALLALAH